MPRVRVQSEVATLSVKRVGTEQIETVLEEAGFFEPVGVINYQANGAMRGVVSVRNVLIIFTGEEQMLGKTYGTGETSPYQSWGVAYRATQHPGVSDVTIYLYVKPEIAGNEEPDKLARRYQGILLRAIWDLTHPKQADQRELARFDGMSEYIKDKVQESFWEIAR